MSVKVYDLGQGVDACVELVCVRGTYTVGVVVPELSDGYSAMVLGGVEDHLLREGYFYFVASHRHRPELIERCPQFFLERCVEGMIAVDTPRRRPSLLPVVSVSGHDNTPGVTNIALNHERAARLALEHMINRGTALNILSL